MDTNTFLSALQRLERSCPGTAVGRAARGLRSSWRTPFADPDGLWFLTAFFSVDGEREDGVLRIKDCGLFWAGELLDDDGAVPAIAERFAPIMPVMPFSTARYELCGGCGIASPIVGNYHDRRTDGIRRVRRDLYVLCTRCPDLTLFGRNDYLPDAD